MPTRTERFKVPYQNNFKIHVFYAQLTIAYIDFMIFFRITSVGAICEILTDVHESDAHAVGQILDILLEDDCVSVDYETVLREERRTEWNATAVQAGIRQYSYQSCSQFVWYHSSNSRFQPSNWQYLYCGSKVRRWSGEFDPWRSVGVQSSLSATAQAIIIAGASHGNDLGPISDDDSPALAAAKARIQEIIAGWIATAGGNVPL
ncbi:hypothetical protein HA402_007563 [Bradysia odoriphaga]|nr:hypothetical protein HA402_007563 [Bradysia odoriphaga]